MTLHDLAHLSQLVSIRVLARACGMKPDTLHSRIRRGQPELTPEESERILSALRDAGLTTHKLPTTRK